MISWARTSAYVIYVDVSTENSYAEGVKAFAEAVGYTTTLSDAEERARKSGFKFPNLDAMGQAELKSILALYQRACRELAAEGKLNEAEHGKPTLVLDHSTRPLTETGRNAQERLRDMVVHDLDEPQQGKRHIHDDTLIRVFLDAAKRSTGESRLFIVTSDVYAEERVISCESALSSRCPLFVPPCASQGLLCVAVARAVASMPLLSSSFRGFLTAHRSRCPLGLHHL